MDIQGGGGFAALPWIPTYIKYLNVKVVGE